MLVVLAASTIAFLLLHLAPGDPFTTLGQGGDVSADVLARQRQQFLLDQPLHVQYLRWMTNMAKGELGWSFLRQEPVAEAIADALPNTLLLMGLAYASSIFFGVRLGGWLASREGSRVDKAGSTIALVIYSIPQFWLGLVLMLIFAGKMGLLPATGMISPEYDYLPSLVAKMIDRFKHLVLPWFALTLVGTAMYSRFQRAAMQETLGEPFLQTGRAKGLPEKIVQYQALRASLRPVITLSGLLFPALLGGAVLVESVFSWPGMGSLVVDAVFRRDYMLVSATVTIVSAMTVIGNLLADVIGALADPRVVAG